MTSLRQLEYIIQDFSEDPKQQSIVPIKIKINDTRSKYLLHKSIVIEDNNKRQGTACSKTRSDVSGGGKKPWKQKGTGRARSGSSNSPLWKGGGVTFGPRPRIYTKKINIKEKRLALATALYAVKDRLVVLKNNYKLVDTVSTKKLLYSLKGYVPCSFSEKLLIVDSAYDEALALSVRNIPFVELKPYSSLTVRDILSTKSILLTEKTLFNIIQSTSK
uniref:ribosomal protein L4 n=1 Tax=Cryptomonas gyropyrenoidosa TaxID=233257 RepID=UPI0027A43304|nr:ribosomal protein L4 [Cryptomonas gyropyrenoidosa]WFQ83000.1 ribosomal protein L4 [Cryptomonas gyropyrenoidosa]